MKLKKFLSLALVGAMTAGLVACGSSDNKDGNENGTGGNGTSEKGNVTLTVWGAEEDQTMLREMADAFIEAHKDDVNLTIEIGVQSESTAKDTVLKDPEAAADVYSFASDQLLELVNAGALMAIPDEMNRADIEARNVAGSVEAASVDGKLYAYPRTADNGYFLFYNKEYLSEEDVASWESMLSAAAAAGKKVTMEMNSGWYQHGFFAAVGLEANLADNGVDTTCNWNATDTEVKGVDVAQAMLDICKNDAFVALEDAEFVTGIKDGTVIAGINGTWNADNAKAAWGDNYAATKLPTFTVNGEEKQMYSVAGYKFVGVNPHCENAGWALQFADYITNKDNQIKSFELRGTGPSNIEAAESDVVKANVAIAAFAKQQAWASIQTVGANFWTATETFGQILQDGNPDGTDLQTLLDNLVAGIEAPIQ